MFAKIGTPECKQNIVMYETWEKKKHCYNQDGNNIPSEILLDNQSMVHMIVDWDFLTNIQNQTK